MFGGQTGVDRAALDAAMSLGISHGGWAPLGREAEDGRIPAIYVLTETPTKEASIRTEWNIRDSDATLILTMGPLPHDSSNGTKLTWELANAMGKPTLHIDVEKQTDLESASKLHAWLERVRPNTLNVAGQKDSESRGMVPAAGPSIIYSKTYALLQNVLPQVSQLAHSPSVNQQEQVLLTYYEQVCANFRHWDQIRWLVPYWFVAIISGISAVLMIHKETPYLRYFLIGMSLFSFFCFWLIKNLNRYHSCQQSQFDVVLNAASVDSATKQALRNRLPFDLRGWRFALTATFWVMVLTIGVGVGSLVGALVVWKR